MFLSIKKSLVKLAVLILTLLPGHSSKAGIGVISLIGGPGGIILIKIGAGLAFGGSAAVLGACYIGDKLVDLSPDCPIFMNFAFWPGLVLMGNESASAPSEIASKLMKNFGADQESANRIADAVYNMAIDSATLSSNSTQLIGTEVEVRSVFSISKEQLSKLATTEFVNSLGFNQLVELYK